MRKHSFKALLALLGAATVACLVAAPAGADPTNAKNAQVVTAHCDPLGTLDVVSNGNGRWTPGLVTTNNQVGVPYEFHVTGTFTPTGGEPESFSDDLVKPAPHNGRLATCTFHQEGADEFGSFVVDGTVLISYTPAH
jgi:hypothetical protein